MAETSGLRHSPKLTTMERQSGNHSEAMPHTNQEGGQLFVKIGVARLSLPEQYQEGGVESRHAAKLDARATRADLIRDCKAYQAEHGIIALLSILEDIIECQAQASGVVLLDEELGEMETAYFTVQ